VRGFDKISSFRLTANMSQNNDQLFIDRLNQHPTLRNRMEALLNVLENTGGDCKNR
jgi:hypothetical protein